MKLIVLLSLFIITACSKQPVQLTQDTLAEIVIYDKYESKAYNDWYFVEYYFTGHIGKYTSEGYSKCFNQQDLEVGKKYKLMMPSDKDSNLFKVRDLCELTTRVKVHNEVNN